MLNKDAKLVENPFDEKIEKKPTRDGFGLGTVAAGKADPNVVVLCADLSESTRAEWFQKEFPDRFIEVGVAEQNLAALAAGFAAVGKVPFIASYAAFSPGRNYEQIRTTIALNQQKVIVCGMHAGVSVGPDGATHQMLEDIGLMRMLPHMTVMVPADAEEARKMVEAAALLPGPSYIRFGRSGTPVFTTPETPFTVGKAQILWRSERAKVGLVGVGSMAHVALIAARALEAAGVPSIAMNLGTIKPIDTESLTALARETSRIVVIEEHQIAGGAGSAVLEALSERAPVPVLRLGLRDEFGQSGEPDELLAHYRLDAASVTHAVRDFVARK
ncbi:MAG: transketolase family protein [Candidatus Pacebacteria bacterium]|nr:transketolase family protein [Candidatus Paceibacterota bacterium]MBP9840762.1 transketolase family protein [Candidatus Paceibacterota bacterium]